MFSNAQLILSIVKNIVIMRITVCYYPFDIPCKLDDVEEIYINVLVLVILPIAFRLVLSRQEK